MMHKGYEIFKDNLGRTCIYNTESQYSRESDHIVINGGTKEAKQEIDNRIERSLPKMMYNREDFKEMIIDWKTDNSPEYDDLEITEVIIENNQWIAYAHDEKTVYSLTDDGKGNIVINYSGTK